MSPLASRDLCPASFSGRPLGSAEPFWNFSFEAFSLIISRSYYVMEIPDSRLKLMMSLLDRSEGALASFGCYEGSRAKLCAKSPYSQYDLFHIL